MRIVHLLLRLLLAPRTLVVLAGVFAAVGLVGGYVTVHENAERQLALRQGPPDPVAIESFRPVVHIGPAREVTLVAQADLGAPILLAPPGAEPSLVVPLYPTGGSTVALGALVVPADGAPDDLGTLAAAARGALVELNGRAVRPGDLELMLAGALAVKGHRLGDRIVAMTPFAGGREAALQPVTHDSRWWLWAVALGGLCAAGALWQGFGHGARAAARARLYAEEAGRAARPHRAPARSDHFAPLPHQDDLSEPTEPERQLAALKEGASALAGALLRGAAAVLRMFRAGVEGIRSPR